MSWCKRPRVLQVGALMVLLVTTTAWSYWSAIIANSNADQLVNPYLFTDWQTFHNAVFPAAHSQLIKWPLFWLIGQSGITPDRLISWTVLVDLLTVGGLAYLLSRIERRPRVFAVICLVLALMLLLVPAQPHAGSLLPVNYAMLTTRNIEYLVFVVGLVLMLRVRRLRSLSGIAAIGVFGLLFASDQLFLQLSGGGAALLLFISALTRKWQIVSLAVKWLLTVGLAALVGFGVITLINSCQLTTILTQGNGVPYQLTTSLSGLLLACLYALIGILLNLGTGPLSISALQVRQIPAVYLTNIVSIGGPALLIMFAVVGLTGQYLYRLIKPVFRRAGTTRLPLALQFEILLISTGLTAGLLFVISDHYYAVDARYLSVWMLAAICGLAVYSRRQRWQPHRLSLAAAVLGVGIISGLLASQRTAQLQAASYVTDNNKNDLIAQALSHHHVTTLVGDYWRVLPTKLVSRGALTVTPLDNCTTQRAVLTSRDWQPDLQNHSFAYLLSSNTGLSGYPGCSYQMITDRYGQPNSRIRISGSIEQPSEQLLIYDHGIKGASQLQQTPLATSVTPVNIRDLDITRCDNATIMNVTAHEDDDLLFINPDTMHSLQAGNCVRSVYLTAGDSGLDKFYWLNRRRGIEAAYATMLKAPDIWVDQTIKLADAQYVTLASLRDHPEVSLLFFNLPDGGIHGAGFAASQYQSLERLRSGQIDHITSVDTESEYTPQSLTVALAEIMQTYQVATVRTQANVPSTQYPDHSDHIVTGLFARDAALSYSQRFFGGNIMIPVQSYIGYPIHSFPEDVSGADLTVKQDAFMAYAAYDGGVCHSYAECAQTSTYGSYLPRQYKE